MSFESSQSQQFSSVQQSSSSSYSQHQQSSNQVFESQEFNGGPVMKGLPRREEEANNRDSGIFTGINGDANSLVDDEFDYKKHTVKDLAKHFALVKPKQNIPHNILPEQRMFNGDHAPQLNYLGANESGAVLQSNTSNRREVSQQDIEASKAAYELKKKQQMEQQSTTTTTQSSSSTVVRRTETSSSSTEQKTERRMSLRDSLMLDPAKAHLDAGLIDPSAILRGEGATYWKSSEPSPTTQLSLRAVSSSPSNQMYISRKDPQSRAFAPVKFSTLPKSSSQAQPQKSSLPPLPTCPSGKNSTNSKHFSSMSENKSGHNQQIVGNATNIPTVVEPIRSNSPVDLLTSNISSNSNNDSNILLPNSFKPEYEATIKTSTKSFTPNPSTSAPLIILDPDVESTPSSSSQFTQSSSFHHATTHTTTSQTEQNSLDKKSVIQTMLKNTGQGDTGHDDLLAVSLSIPEVSRSSAPTPAPTTPFPGLDHHSNLTVPPSPTLRPRTPILVTTRPSSVLIDRTRHVSKDDIAKMMAELNEPLPPMLDIPTEIRASPLIFLGGLASSSHLTSSSSLVTSQSSTVSHKCQ